MKTGKQYSVLFQFKNMDGEINMIVDVPDGISIEKAVQKKNQTKREVIILSKILLNEWSYGK